MKDKVVLITGANSGIGRVMAEEIADDGATVVLVCRNETKGRAALEEIRQATGNHNLELIVADLSVLADVRRVAQEFRDAHERLHVLINNAGAIQAKRVLSADGFEMTFAVNHLAYFLLTTLLLDVIQASAPARIINVSSAAHQSAGLDLDNVQLQRGYSNFKAYSNSKLMNLLFTYELARRLHGTGVTVNAYHPGGVATGFARNGSVLLRVMMTVFRPWLITPAQGADTGVYLAMDPALDGVTGKYFYKREAVASTKDSHDRRLQDGLWTLSEELTGLAASADAA